MAQLEYSGIWLYDIHFAGFCAGAENGDTSEAIIHYNEALRIKPQNASIHTNLGIELYAIGKVDEAIEHSCCNMSFV